MDEQNGQSNGKPMSDEQRQRTMDFILEHQAKFFVDIEALKEAIVAVNSTQDISLRRLERIERIVTMALVVGRRVRSDFRKTQEDLRLLAESHREQNEKINILIDSHIAAQEEMREIRAEAKEAREEMKELRGIVKEMANSITATNKRIDNLEYHDNNAEN